MMGDLVKEVRRVHKHRKRAAKLGLRADLRTLEWGQILRKFNHRCAYCGSSDDVGLDHVVPLCNGGGTTFTNVVPCCVDCGRRKGTAVWL